MTKADFILKELENGNFNVLSELEIIKSTTTKNPAILEKLYNAYAAIESILSSTELVYNNTEGYKPGVKVIVELPEINKYKETLAELEELRLNGGAGSSRELELEHDTKDLFLSMNNAKIAQHKKEFEIYQINGDDIVLSGLPGIKWNKKELKLK